MLTLKGLQQLCNFSQIGLKSGRDLTTIFEWMRSQKLEPKIIEVMDEFQNHSKVRGSSFAARVMADSMKDLPWKMFFEVVEQSHKGSQHLAPLFKNLEGIAYSIEKLNNMKKANLLIPKAQMLVSALVALLFIVGLPMMAPEFFPTFISLGRPDLLAAGISLIGLGFYFQWKLQMLPEKKVGKLLQTGFFLEFLNLYIEGGSDFSTAWKKSLEKFELPPELKNKLKILDFGVENCDVALSQMSGQLPDPWPSLCTGMIWARQSGVGFCDFLKETAKKENERVLFLWEVEIRKLSFLSMLPISLLVFPAIFFLLMGPQLMSMSQF